jgi:chaperone BCS1
MPASTKEPLLEDLADFLSEDTYEFYHEHGIPYKRSYLFHGQPGGGKTSLITALAGLQRLLPLPLPP